MRVTLEEVKNYIRVDSDYEDDFITELIDVSQIYIDSMVGVDYKTDEKAMKLSSLLQKKLISDMYNQRSTEIASNTKKDIIVKSILDKLSNYYID